MIRISDIRIKPKLVTFFLLTGCIPLIVSGFFGSQLASNALLEKSFNQLITVQDIRKTQVEDFFTGCVSDLQTLAELGKTKQLLQTINQLKTEEAATVDVTSSPYQSATQPYHRYFKEILHHYGYQDVFLIDRQHGNVLFSLEGGDELGTSLDHGLYKTTALAHVWKQVVLTNNTAISDFDSYAPSDGAESMFFAHPIRDEMDRTVGVLALQLTEGLINHAVDSRQGMGETGESYLMGVIGNGEKFEFRSNIRTMGEGRYVIGYSMNPLNYWLDAVEKQDSGGEGVYTDSSGAKVLVVYNRLNIDSLEWYLISKVNYAEVTAPVRSLRLILIMVAGTLICVITLGALYISRALTKPIIADMKFAQAIAENKLDTTLDVNQNDELGDLARALNTMARKLQKLDWLKVGKEGLDDQLRGEYEPEELAKRLVTYITKYLGAELGAIYLLENDDLILKSSYAFSDRSGNFNRIQLGEGMVGQAALENEVIVFSNIKENAPALNYGAGEQIPENYLAVPIAFENKVFGVLLLGSISPFSNLEREFVDHNLSKSGVLMNAAKSRQVIRELLEQAKEQQEELQATNEELEEQTHALQQSEAEMKVQREELRATNEELEEQTKALQQSEAELQAQQEELRVTNEELEERTKALLEQTETIGKKNADLIKAQKIVHQKAKDLEMASTYKSEFLANMSHELRTPLNSIIILSQLFGSNRDGNLSAKQVESANAINSSGAELLHLINEILDLSKVEAGKIELNIEDVYLDNIVNDLNRVFKELATEKGLGFFTDISPALPPSFTSDSQRLQQVLRNLLSNALKFTKQGAVSVSISRPSPKIVAGTQLDPATSIAFSVKDEGIGISPEKQEAIFNAFQQADGSTSRTYGGTGLGLSISKEFTALLGGVIRLTSKEGVGSTFTMVLPEQYAEVKREGILPKGLLSENGTNELTEKRIEGGPLRGDILSPDLDKASETLEEDNLVSCTQQPEETKKPVIDKPIPPCRSEYLDDDREGIDPESRSLLIIEDDKQFAKVMRDFGRERGFMCLLAEDGETGLHFADYYKPSAIILDIGLPGIDGWTVMERLKENPELRHIPVHFMSADDKSLDAMRMGAVGFLSKPVNVEKIEEAFGKIEKIVSKPVSSLLVVEDDQIHRDSIKQLIGNGDVLITAVGSGKEAFEQLEKGSFDCMVLDLGLGDMTGFDLLEKIRESGRAAQVPVIIYTGRDLTKEEEQKLNQYAESIIIKGVKSPERLLEESALFLHRVEANLPAEKQKMLQAIQDKEEILSDKCILLVDDDMRNVFALSSVLEDRNMDVIVAKNGLECLEKLEKNGDKIDCILMDIMMPQMDGYEAMREIRKQKKYEKLPILALTAKAMKGDRAKCIDAGASDYMAKPVNTDKLLSLMKVWLY